jgi:hypothetical protein
MNELTFAGRAQTTPGCMPTGTSTYTARRFWTEHGDASLNWLALGLLLAAWNAADNDAVNRCAPATASAQPTVWGSSAR